MKTFEKIDDTTWKIASIEYHFSKIIERHPDGGIKRASLAKDVTVTIAGIHYTFKKVEDHDADMNRFIAFYPNGHVQWGCLKEPVDITVAHTLCTFTSIGFYEDGMLWSGMLNKEETFVQGGARYTFSHIHVAKNGTLIQGMRFSSEGKPVVVRFYEDGTKAYEGPQWDHAWFGQK